MANTNVEREIQARVEEFVADLTALIRRAALESVEQALGNEAPRAVRQPTARVRSSREARKGSKRSAERLEELTKRLLGEIKGKPGQRIEEIARTMKTTTKELALPARRLLDSKKVKTTGQKRATKYFPR